MTTQERADDAVRGLADQYAIDARLGLKLIFRVREAIEAAVAARTEEIIAWLGQQAEAMESAPLIFGKSVPPAYRTAAMAMRVKFLPAKEAAGQLRWSKTQPAESGYYWWQGRAGVIGIVELYAGLRPASWWVKFHGEEKEYPAAECEGEWAGPIYPPREADHAQP